MSRPQRVQINQRFFCLLFHDEKQTPLCSRWGPSDDCFRSFLDGVESWAAEMAAERKRMGKDSGVS